eukprot:280302_1
MAFFAGTITDLPGLRYFCFYAAFSSLGNYILQFLMFVPLLVYDNERIRANRNSCCPCVVHENEYDSLTDSEEELSSHSYCSLRGILEHCLVRLLSSLRGRICVILSFILVTVLSGYLATKVKAVSDSTMLVPDDSYIKEFFRVSNEAWPGLQPKEIQMVFVDVDFSDAATRNKVHSLMDKVEHLDAVVGGINNWLEPFTKYVMDTKGVDVDSIDKRTFYSYLKDFAVASNFSHWSDELVLDDEGQITRFYFNALESSDGMKQYDSYLLYNGLMEEEMGNGFMIESQWIHSYFDHALKSYTLNNIIISLCAVLLTLLLLMDMRVAIFIMVIIVCIDVCLFGWMYLLAIDLQAISFCQLCMAVGMTVDYVIHMVHAIASHNGRIRVAMLQTGRSVIKGAFTHL